MYTIEMLRPAEERLSESTGIQDISAENPIPFIFRDTSQSVIVYDRLEHMVPVDVLSAEAVKVTGIEKTTEEIWGKLTRDAKVVAVALSQFPSDVTESTVENMIAAQNENNKDAVTAPFDAKKGLLELNNVGVLTRMTVLERAESIMKEFESLSIEEQERIKAGHGLSFKDEKMLLQYLGAQRNIVDYKRDPSNERWSRVGYSVPEQFKVLARQKKIDDVTAESVITFPQKETKIAA